MDRCGCLDHQPMLHVELRLQRPLVRSVDQPLDARERARRALRKSTGEACRAGGQFFVRDDLVDDAERQALLCRQRGVREKDLLGARCTRTARQ
ncbi:hypothetical protein D3C87_1948950 [compost metagenome]